MPSFLRNSCFVMFIPAMGILVGGVGHLFPFQNAHCVGFSFFSHCYSLFDSIEPSQAASRPAPPKGGAYAR